MKKTLFLLLVSIGLFFINSCSKDDPKPTPAPAPTRLELSIKDNLGNSVSGASVKLYSSQTDWNAGTNQIGTTLVSDASGKVTFTDLSNISYFWLVEKDCQNNVRGAVTTVSPLTANVTTSLNIILSTTGTLKLVNTSSNPYRVYINGTAAVEMNGGTNEMAYYVPTGAYSIRILQLSGYAVYPTDQTYNVNVGCGQTSTVTFPQ